MVALFFNIIHKGLTEEVVQKYKLLFLLKVFEEKDFEDLKNVKKEGEELFENKGMNLERFVLSSSIFISKSFLSVEFQQFFKFIFLEFFFYSSLEFYFLFFIFFA